MHVHIDLKPDTFRIFWAKHVSRFTPNQHCARCLIGPFEPSVPFGIAHAGGTFDFGVPNDKAPFLYLCGVTYRYEDNLHIAVRPGAGAVEYSDDRIAVRITGAVRLPIERQPTDKPEIFARCRNYQFGLQYVAPFCAQQQPSLRLER